MPATERRCVFQFKVEWAMWGNMNALYAAVRGVVAATVELISLDPAISVPVHSYGTVSRWIVMDGFRAISLFVFFCEYPRSARRNRGKNVERPGQKYLAPILKLTGLVGKHYLIRFVMYLMFLIPCFFVLSSLIGAICLFFACCCYFIAALNGEEWTAPSVAWGPGAVKESSEKHHAGHVLPEAPDRPPPRPPQQKS